MAKKSGFLIILMLACVLFLAGNACAAAAAAGNEEKEKAALPAAETWIKLIDAGNYAESWNTSSEYFRKNIRQEQWDQVMKGLREPLGKMLNRTVKSARYVTAVPGGPDGEYVVIQFQTSFENKKWTVETITPMLEKDGTWKISGYYLN